MAILLTILPIALVLILPYFVLNSPKPVSKARVEGQPVDRNQLAIAGVWGAIFLALVIARPYVVGGSFSLRYVLEPITLLAVVGLVIWYRRRQL